MLGSGKVFVQVIDVSCIYVNESNFMYVELVLCFEFEQCLVLYSEEVLMIVDEVSVLMLDLSYLDMWQQGVEIIIGVGINIDNKLLIMNIVIIDFVVSIDLEVIVIIIDDLSYQISNI